jgi:serine protease inhibitor
LQQQLFADSSPNIPWPTKFDSKVGSIQLPKFKVDYETELVPILKSLGMTIATEPDRADFSGIAPPPTLYINQVKHKTFIEVNETGTTAAAVTSVEVSAGSAAPVSPFQMIVNRPFFIAIEDQKTHVILFMGSIYDPTN